MRLLGTRSNLYGSRLIRSVTGENISHVALDMGCGFTIHSNFFRGVHTQSTSTFRENNEIIYDIPVSVPREDVLIRYSNIEFQRYDKSLALMLGLRNLFPSIIPKQDLWNCTGMFICTELIHTLLPSTEKLMTPEKLVLSLQQKDDH